MQFTAVKPSPGAKEKQMTKPATIGPTAVGRRVMLLLTALIAAMALYFSATVSSAAAQTSYNFCAVTLAPYGQYGDRCSSWGGGYLSESSVIGYDHSACIDYTNGINENLMYSWACAPAPQPGQFTLREVDFWNDGIYRKPIIRNNTTGDSNKVAGHYNCYTDC